MIRIYVHPALECYSTFYVLEEFISVLQFSFAFLTVHALRCCFCLTKNVLFCSEADLKYSAPNVEQTRVQNITLSNFASPVYTSYEARNV
jgi:hypothetical protein